MSTLTPEHVRDFLSRLNNPKPAGGGWMATCPSHEDRKASLSVRQGGDGKVLVKCHAGCTAEQVVADLGLTMSSLFPPKDEPTRKVFRVPPPRPSATPKPTTPAVRPKIVKTWGYFDESGTLLNETVRYEPKEFKYRRPLPGGGWSWNLEGVRRVLLRLPQLINADHDATVYVCEGEHDVEAVEAAGGLATCSIGGAGKWRPEYAEFLSGRQVVVIPHNDEPGRKHAADVAASIHRRAAVVKVLKPLGEAKGYDAADFLEDDGGTLADIQRMADVAPDWTPAEKDEAEPPAADDGTAADEPAIPILSAFDAIVSNEPEPEQIIHGLFRRRELGVVSSGSKSRKTWTSIDVAIAVALGEVWAEQYPTTAANVLYIDAELSPETLAYRMRQIAQARGVDPARLKGRLDYVTLRGTPTNLRTMWPAIFSRIKPSHYGLIVIDSLYKLYPPGVDENDNGAMAELMNLLIRYAKDLDAALWVVHHVPKGDSSSRSTVDFGAGAGTVARSADMLLALRPHEQDDAIVVEAANRSLPRRAPFCLRWEFPVFQPADDLDPVDLLKPTSARKTREAKPEKPKPEPWTPERVAAVVGKVMRTKAAIVEDLCFAGAKRYQAAGLIATAETAGTIHRHKRDGSNAAYFSTLRPENPGLKYGDGGNAGAAA